ncbi:MAG TPA: hypothetical protein VIX73_33015, partial [Kofleriaceae bacterium]
DASGEGPTVTTLQLTANTHASELYPDTRIGIAIGGLGSLALTIAQLDTLCAQLQRAKYDVHTGGVPVTTATGDEGRCESCSLPIQAGELVQTWATRRKTASWCTPDDARRSAPMSDRKRAARLPRMNARRVPPRIRDRRDRARLPMPAELVLSSPLHAQPRRECAATNAERPARDAADPDATNEGAATCER